jgi:hypothetical protein
MQRARSENQWKRGMKKSRFFLSMFLSLHTHTHTQTLSISLIYTDSLIFHRLCLKRERGGLCFRLVAHLPSPVMLLMRRATPAKAPIVFPPNQESWCKWPINALWPSSFDGILSPLFVFLTDHSFSLSLFSSPLAHSLLYLRTIQTTRATVIGNRGEIATKKSGMGRCKRESTRDATLREHCNNIARTL